MHGRRLSQRAQERRVQACARGLSFEAAPPSAGDYASELQLPTTTRSGQKRSAVRIVLPRIKDSGAAVAHVADIPGDKVKVVLQRRRCHERVDDGWRMSRLAPNRAADRAPPADDSIGNRDQSVGEPGGQAVSGGRVERSTRVVVGEIGNALVILPQGQDTEIQRGLVLSSGPGFHTGRPSRADDLRRHVGVDQPADQSSTSRPVSRSRVRSRPSTVKLSMKVTKGTGLFDRGSKRSNSSAAITTTASWPRTVTRWGPSSRARRTTSLKRALAS